MTATTIAAAATTTIHNVMMRIKATITTAGVTETKKTVALR